jgi:outer membrane protein assembly factor BamB
VKTHGALLLGGLRAALLAVLCAALPAACASLTARSPESTDEHPHPAGVAQIRWRTELHQHGLFEPAPEECATGALVGQGQQLVIGSRASAIVSVGTERGQVQWATSASGGIDSQAYFDAKHNQVYVGADDGTFYSLDPTAGNVRWSYHAKGAIEQAPDVGGDTVYFGTAADRVIALDASNGKWRWQYERETPEGFTIHGYSGPRAMGEDVIAGFSDGYLVSLNGGSGEVVWARSLAAVSDQFVDVDSTPTVVGNTIYASSYSGGLYAVDAKDGAVRWRVGIEGVSSVFAARSSGLAGSRLYFAAPREGLHAADRDGHVLWRQGLRQAGDLTTPVVVGSYLVFSGSRAGLFIVDRETGKLLEIFNPGSGICAAPTIDPSGSRLYVLSNGGALYALDLT